MSGRSIERRSPEKPKKPKNDNIEFWSYHFIQQIFLGLANYLIATFPVIVVSFMQYGFGWAGIAAVLCSNELFYASCVVCCLYLIDFITYKSKDQSKSYYIQYNVILGFYLFVLGFGLVMNVMYVVNTGMNMYDMTSAFRNIFDNKIFIVIFWTLFPFCILFLQQSLNYLSEKAKSVRKGGED